MASVIAQVETDHSDLIHDVQMDYYGTRFATCSSDRAIKIYSCASGNNTLEATLEGHDAAVWQVSWSHPSFGNYLASCSYDRKVFIWKEQDIGSWTKVHEHKVHESSVNSVAWAPKEFGLILACASSDGSISILTHKNGCWEDKRISKAHSQSCNCISWRPSLAPSSVGLSEDESVAIMEDSKVPRFVTGGSDSLLKIWKYIANEDKWIEECKLEGHSDWVRDVAWAASIGNCNSYIASCSQDQSVLIWSRDFRKNTWTHRLLKMFNDIVWHVSWSLMGNILAVSYGENKVSLFKESLSGELVCISDKAM